jgi:hypothetical protein
MARVVNEVIGELLLMVGQTCAAVAYVSDVESATHWHSAHRGMLQVCTPGCAISSPWYQELSERLIQTVVSICQVRTPSPTQYVV